jgi:hypothetical protein
MLLEGDHEDVPKDICDRKIEGIMRLIDVDTDAKAIRKYADIGHVTVCNIILHDEGLPT